MNSGIIFKGSYHTFTSRVEAIRHQRVKATRILLDKLLINDWAITPYNGSLSGNCDIPGNKCTDRMARAGCSMQSHLAPTPILLHVMR
ncbi:hypothetical protein CEXT_376561 [Caerostris extrusa]|uniref:RNase H type-1 domain-containing protein n=1 Tax=Caerostris extrusa TaxID=172846 RepID=A0AAV4SDT9_CAEEX|nr:hypothetical protein CEXT_376561 [Caerostris extrusa]